MCGFREKALSHLFDWMTTGNLITLSEAGMRLHIFQITTERNVFVVRRWEQLCFSGGWARAGLKCTGHTVLFMCPGLSSCMFDINSSPSFILILLFTFFLCHPPPLLMSLLSVHNAVCYAPLQGTLYSTSFFWVMKTRLPCFSPLRSAPGSSFMRLMGTPEACQLFQQQSCLRNKGHLLLLQPWSAPSQNRGNWGWTFQNSEKSPPICHEHRWKVIFSLVCPIKDIVL